MQAVKIQTAVETDGELHLTGLPCRKGNRVEVIVLITDETTEAEREAALQRFLAGARASTFKSEGPYPSRDELHERD
ncbi:MAG TPA: hypothetical protein VJ739_03340 [Gemmataceae bacterium]|nr:hypothetical protein [Gemmataceae bacterium]